MTSMVVGPLDFSMKGATFPKTNSCIAPENAGHFFKAPNKEAGFSSNVVKSTRDGKVLRSISKVWNIIQPSII